MREFIGYHGTTKENGMAILKTRQFISSGTYDDWLGKGVYFFEDDKHQAYMYVKYKEGKEHILPHNEICVLHSKIIVSDLNVLNLITDEDKRFLYEYCSLIEERINKKREEIGDWQHKEGFVIDSLMEDTDGGLDLIRAAYQVPKQRLKYKNFDFLNTHIQLCVKNARCIVAEEIKEVDCDAYRRNEEKSVG